MTTILEAAGADANDFLESQASHYYDYVRAAVSAGKSPDDIYSEVLREVGEHRKPLAIRCRQMAHYLQGEG